MAHSTGSIAWVAPANPHHFSKTLWMTSRHELIQYHLGTRDHTKYIDSESNKNLGMILESSVRKVEVQIFLPVTTELYQQHSLQLITACRYPIVDSSGMIEVLASEYKAIIPWSNILDVVFILPGNSIIQPCHPNLCFESFNWSHSRSLHHGPSSRLSMKTFLIFFPGEALLYLHHKLTYALRFEVENKESRIICCSTLQMEARSTWLQKVYIRVADKSSLQALQDILGITTGSGLAKSHPTKKQSLEQFTIGGILTSV
jgi:hypothetical protein